MKQVFVLSKVNLKNQKLAMIITLSVIVAQFVSDTINYIINVNLQIPDNMIIGIGSYFYLFPLLIAVFTPALNFRKFINLNVKKSTYIKGCALCYLMVAPVIALLNIVFYFSVEKLFSVSNSILLINIIDVFGWINNGILVAFFRQTAFLLMVMAIVHTITTIQTFWYGYVIDAIIIAIISVFTPIPVLRSALVFFFNQIIFNSNSLLQILYCLIIGIVVYTLGIIPVKQKNI